MCLARIFVRNDRGITCSEPDLSDVARIEFEKDGLVLTDILGSSECIRATVRSIDFLEGTVLLQMPGRRSPAGADGRAIERQSLSAEQEREAAFLELRRNPCPSKKST